MRSESVQVTVGSAGPALASRQIAEGVGTAFLVATVVGSGIMGERLSGGSVGLALLANTLSTGAALLALILTFGPISGAHFNPAVTLSQAWLGGLRWRETPLYIAAQMGGAFIGVALAHWMFELSTFSASEHVRTGPAQILSEFVEHRNRRGRVRSGPICDVRTCCVR